MARCEQGYLCEVCGNEVIDITDSDLYLRFILREVDARELLASPERHLRCNPTLTQFIVAEDFESIVVEGPFAKENLDPHDVQIREQRVTRAWDRLQQIPTMGIPISEYPLEEPEA